MAAHHSALFVLTAPEHVRQHTIGITMHATLTRVHGLPRSAFGAGSILTTVTLLLASSRRRDVPKVLSCKVKVVVTKPPTPGCAGSSRLGGGTKIVTAFFPYTHRSTGQRAKLTILYSHGNAVDLGHMLPVYRCASILFVLHGGAVLVCRKPYAWLTSIQATFAGIAD